VHATMLGGLIYPRASLLRSEGRGTLRGTVRRGEDRGHSGSPTRCPSGRPARRATRRMVRGGRTLRRLGAWDDLGKARVGAGAEAAGGPRRGARDAADTLAGATS
jgi:hypothetical protein